MIPASIKKKRSVRVRSYEREIASLDAARETVTFKLPEGWVTLTQLDKVLWHSAGPLPAYTRRD